MKKVIVAALLVVGITAFAQEKDGRRAGREKLTSEQKVDLQVKKLTKDLDLNEKQAKEVRALVTTEVAKREAKKAEIQELKTKKREEMKAQREADQAAISSDMKKILTADQYAKWEKNREERKANMKEKLAERKEKRKSKSLPESK
ncbi:guided entry of tail-anchored proteins factor 1 [Flavobacterium sp. AS60]|uniref:guided entry of tail-anchored proteins factor 1 n=1 Tax=Flavobacterium anseongense TaxID=2910677 RepID=UPI001F29764E|nr:guided entry of tail-anchored proteins factor 1 [Flavobacterium sp. AS60]MCF6128232.1 guided entry of tail-anchored proteins factor 1 [Flavobacterium sp. AS60]